jgi:murein DD-endopeptidase MepM/ murein hydrolase activator NlpD
MPPPRPGLALLLLPPALVLLALLLPRPASAGPSARWRWPVHGELVGVFRYAPRHPFAAAQRRGVDIAAVHGAIVRSACRGRVTFAGPVPGRGAAVTVRCGALVATHLGLDRPAVRRGAVVAAGDRLGRVGPSGRVRLGARRAAARFGYVDPLALVAGDQDPGPAAGPGPAPLPRGRSPLPAAPHSAPAPRAVRPTGAPRLLSPHALDPRPRPAAGPLRTAAGPRPRPATRPADAAPAIPGLAWAGLILLAAGVPLGGLVHHGRRRRRATRGARAAAGAR